MNYKIQKGDKFKCIKTFKMECGEVAYTKGKEYISEVKGSIKDNQNFIRHEMNDVDNFFEHFKLIK